MLIGYRYTRKDNLDNLILCHECNDGYRGNYGNITLYKELHSIDQWAQRQICTHCGRKLIDTMEEETRKPGPKSRYGERRGFLLNLPLDLWEALDRVAQPEPGYTVFIETAIREKLARKE